MGQYVLHGEMLLARDDRIILVVTSDGQDRFGDCFVGGANWADQGSFFVLKML